MVEEEHVIQTDLFVYTRFKKLMFQVIANIKISKYTHIFSLEAKIVEILTTLNWK